MNDYEKHQQKLKEFDVSKDKYLKELCINNWCKILNNLGYKYKILLDCIVELVDYKIYIMYHPYRDNMWFMEWRRIKIDDEMFPWGDLFREEDVIKSLEKMIKISELLGEDR